VAHTPWDKGRIKLLERLCASGLPYRDIAARLGGGITKNAAIGKAQREGFAVPKSTRPDAISAKRQARPPRAAAPRRAKGSPALSALFADGYVSPAEEVVIPTGERKGIADLEPNDCRWPIGDPQSPDFHFCAREKVPGLSYCRQHGQRAYQPPTAARRTFVPFAVNSNTKRESEDA
jgi:GcrA cell cycle regulator